MPRRTVIGTLLASAGLLLSACGVGRNLGDEVAQAVEAVDGVTGADLESGRNSRFGTSVTGTVTIDAADPATGEPIYDEAMRAAVTLLHERGEDGVIVGGIRGVLRNGSELDALVLDPEFPTGDHRLMSVTASSLYSRYGLA